MRTKQTLRDGRDPDTDSEAGQISGRFEVNQGLPQVRRTWNPEMGFDHR